MRGALEYLDGKKRYLLLVLYLAQGVAELAGYPLGPRFVAVLEVAFASREMASAVVLVLYLAQLVATVYAIRDGVRKDREKRARIVR